MCQLPVNDLVYFSNDVTWAPLLHLPMIGSDSCSTESIVVYSYELEIENGVQSSNLRDVSLRSKTNMFHTSSFKM